MTIGRSIGFLGVALASMGYLSAAHCADAPVLLNVNDVSILFPVPKTKADVERLISADEKLSGGEELWAPAAFKQVLDAAESANATVKDSSDAFHAIRLRPEFRTLHTWKVAGIRFDPSTPGCDARSIALFGSIPQIRFILQPVTVAGDVATVHDFAAHAVFDFTTRDLRFKEIEGGKKIPIPAVPDNGAFAKVVDGLVALKKTMATKGVVTDGALGVHPAFAAAGGAFTEELRGLLKPLLKPARFKHVAFMGIERPEPWLFFIADRSESGAFVLNSTAGTRMFSKRDRPQVLPEPTNLQFGAFGVSTAPLLQGKDVNSEAAPPVLGLGRPVKLAEVPDIIANPHLTRVFGTDCVSCHTESSLRRTKKLDPSGPPLGYAKPEGFQGVKPEAVAETDWNVRNFGWGVNFPTRTTQATVAVRTANESADVAEFINHNFLLPAKSPPGSVVNALTLVMKAKDSASAAELKKVVTGLQNLPPARNPVLQALNRLGNVHDARFVFLDDEHLAVITTYDDDFNTYIDQFVDEIGGVFDKILGHVEGGGPLVPVGEHREQFRAFVAEHDRPVVGVFYSAYPALRVRDVKALQLKAGAAP